MRCRSSITDHPNRFQKPADRVQMRAGDALFEHGWIPREIDVDDGVGRLEIEAGGARVGAHERLATGIALELRNQLLALLLRHLAVEPHDTLLDVLREKLDLTGAKRACDRGECGACAVLVDDRPMLACNLLVMQVRNRSITTIEGLASDGELHPVQRAFHEQHGLQCGYCTAGMVMAAVSLIGEQPDLDEAAVREGLEGNLCRCTGYHNIVKAVLAAAGTGGAS